MPAGNVCGAGLQPLAADKQPFENGRIYIGPSDYHLLIKKDHVSVTKGVRENRYRPAIDPLFRSAAAIHGPRVIGVLLTGALDDGTAGLMGHQKMRRCNHRAGPQDRLLPGNAAERIEQHARGSLRGHRGDGQPPGTAYEGASGKTKSIPEAVRTEALIAERVLSDVAQVTGLGEQVPYNCPNCGGVLWEMEAPDLQRYRCHTGHSFTATALLAASPKRSKRPCGSLCECLKNGRTF